MCVCVCVCVCVAGDRAARRAGFNASQDDEAAESCAVGPGGQRCCELPLAARDDQGALLNDGDALVGEGEHLQRQA